MHAGKRYTLKQFLFWTRRDIYILIIFATIPTSLYFFLDWKWLAIPWVPIALIGTAAAFIVGFRNTQTYNRLWEARQIYGAIVNTSRSWGLLVKDQIAVNLPESKQKEIHQQLIYRHIAWLTAMRYQLRVSKIWENIKDKPSNIEYSNFYKVEEWEGNMEDAIKSFLSIEEQQYVLSKKNRATHIISLQSKHLKELRKQELIEQLNYIELEALLINLYEQQGKCERIKNFPYPRQFATINQMFIRLFMSLIPFGTLNEFSKLSKDYGEWFIWLTVPFSVTVAWVFLAMERIGESTENPFEGGANDVPITSMSRTIEIDLREMLDETQLPPAIEPMNDILM
ncbi:multidrug transporter [Taibaiella lutea]|uniref:Multidrug transporter n=1 Tax=Taibaiella lutea TaxID=2608001 RepID=A0A5M6CND9_9BACT|nr:bestrophin family ion channel [Taibaiella lutea]KAA5536563.1 multidrug transporter [Taibaiella lutea]